MVEQGADPFSFQLLGLGLVYCCESCGVGTSLLDVTLGGVVVVLQIKGLHKTSNRVVIVAHMTFSPWAYLC